MKNGDFIRLDFDAFVKETDQLVDTTHEEVAKEHDVYNERMSYKPVAVIVGSGNIVKGLDADLIKAEKGKEREVEIPPADAFGERDPKIIEVFPMNKILSLPEFRKGDRYPAEGMELRINNRIGYINRIFAGRVRVDFNNRWAGRTILYRYTVVNVITRKEDKVRAIIEASYANPDEFNMEFKGKDTVNITLPDMAKLDQGWTMAKFKLVSDLRTHLGLRIVRLIEEYVKKEEEAEEAPVKDESGKGEEEEKQPAKDESGKDTEGETEPPETPTGKVNEASQIDEPRKDNKKINE